MVTFREQQQVSRARYCHGRAVSEKHGTTTLLTARYGYAIVC